MNPLPYSQAWRNRAAECRTAAATFHNESNRQRMLRVAAGYERMASAAAKQELAEAERRGECAIEIMFMRAALLALLPGSAATPAVRSKGEMNSPQPAALMDDDGLASLRMPH